MSEGTLAMYFRHRATIDLPGEGGRTVVIGGIDRADAIRLVREFGGTADTRTVALNPDGHEEPGPWTRMCTNRPERQDPTYAGPVIQETIRKWWERTAEAGTQADAAGHASDLTRWLMRELYPHLYVMEHPDD